MDRAEDREVRKEQRYFGHGTDTREEGRNGEEERREEDRAEGKDWRREVKRKGGGGAIMEWRDRTYREGGWEGGIWSREVAKR